jgi:hypothetical protein
MANDKMPPTREDDDDAIVAAGVIRVQKIQSGLEALTKAYSSAYYGLGIHVSSAIREYLKDCGKIKKRRNELMHDLMDANPRTAAEMEHTYPAENFNYANHIKWENGLELTFPKPKPPADSTQTPTHAAGGAEPAASSPSTSMLARNKSMVNAAAPTRTQDGASEPSKSAQKVETPIAMPSEAAAAEANDPDYGPPPAAVAAQIGSAKTMKVVRIGRVWQRLTFRRTDDHS